MPTHDDASPRPSPPPAAEMPGSPSIPRAPVPTTLRFESGSFAKGAFVATLALAQAMLGGDPAMAQDPASPAPATPPATPPNANAPTTPGATNPATNLPEVTVTGQGEYKADSLSLQKFAGPLLTLPQSAAVVTDQVMKDQAISNVRDALRNVSGISVGAGEGSYQGDNISIRGFAARSDIYLDGISDFGNYNRDPFNLEEIEVLKGPSSVEFGRGSAGGVVNQVSKTPQLSGFVAGSLMYGTDHTRQETVDIDEPIPGIPNAAFRLNAMDHFSDVTDRDGAAYSRWGIAPSVAFGINTPFRITVSYFHQTEDDRPDYGIPWLFDRPAPVPQNNFYGFNDDYLKTDVNIGTIKIEQDLNDTFTVRNIFRVANYHRSFRITQADTGDILPGTPLRQMSVARDIIDGVSNDRLIDEQVELVAKFKTGSLEHHLVIGGEYQHEAVDPRRIEPTWAGVPNTSLLYPAGAMPFPGYGVTGTEVNAEVNTLSAYAIDTIKIDPKWSFIASLRFDDAASSYYESVPPIESLVSDDTALTWRAALVFQPQPNGTIYFAAGTAFHPNVAQLSISSEPTLPASTKDVAVGRNFEMELGTKWDLFDKRLTLSGALFLDIETNPAPVDLDDPLIDVLHGKEQVKGIEFSAVGHLTDKWQMLVSYTLQSSDVTSSSDPTMIGNPVLNCPENTFSLWTTYELPYKFQVGFGANAVSSRTASLSPDPLNGLLMEAPGYWIFSAMLKYHLTDKIDLQANVTNLADKYYYDGVHPGHVVPGEGRTLFISTNFKF